jgi:hypothetical protein
MPEQSVEHDQFATQNSTWFAKFKRWMYRDARPNWLARIVNRAYALVGSIGLTGDYMETLEVTGRKSGRSITFPVCVVPYEGERYLVSMLGDNSQWVQNVRTAGGTAALYSGGRKDIHLEEIPIASRAPILKAYLQRAPGARPHIPVSPDAPLAEFEQIAAEYPVFTISQRES